MKNKILRSIASILAGAMVVSALTGCGQEAGKTTNVSNEKKEESTQNSSESVSTEAQKTEPEEITYPLEGDIKLTMWVSERLPLYSEYLTAEESPFHSGLEKNTGVDIEWEFLVQGADATTSYNLMLQDEELPNIIFDLEIDAEECARLLQNGLIYDLTEYLPVYAPDYWEYINRPENADVLREIKTSDGKITCFGFMRENQTSVTYIGPMLRKDWLDECGLDEPVTLEDWEEVLVAFKDKYNATLSGPFGQFKQVGISSGVNAQGGFEARYYVDDNGKVQLAQVQKEWKEQMEILNRWYSMGLIDKDFATATTKSTRAKALNGEIGIVIAARSQLANYNTDAEKENTGAKWVGFGYSRVAADQPTSHIQGARSAYSGNSGTVITTSCSEEELIAALKFLNYGYTEEGIMYYNFGNENVSYLIDDKGDVQWTDLVTNDAAGMSEAVKKYVGVWGASPSIQLARFSQLKNGEVAYEAVFKWVDNTVSPEHYLPSLSYTEEESARYTDLATAIDTYLQPMALKFITGEESLDNFDAFVNEMNKLGLEECLEIQQAAYDRFMAK